MNQPTTERIEPTSRTRRRRIAGRGVFDRATMYAILDEALICHVGFVEDGQPFVIPMIHARMGDRLLLHGSPGSRMLTRLRAGEPFSVTVTILDGLVLARSLMHHSVNYRSVVILAKAAEVTGREEKRTALNALTEHVVPGQWDHARRPSDKELDATMVLSLPLDEMSAKIRTGPPIDEPADYELPVWAGVIPLSLTPGAPQPDPKLAPGTSVPQHIVNWRRSKLAGTRLSPR